MSSLCPHLLRSLPVWLLLMSLCFPLRGQTLSDDVLQLKDGSVIKGRILSQEAGKIRIELLGGSILVYGQEEVEAIRKEPSPYRKIRLRLGREYENREITYRKPGLYHVVSIDWAFNESQWNSLRLDPHFHYAAGRHFNRYVNIGLGTGLDLYEGGLLIPWYADFRGDLWEKKLTPTYYLNAGYAFAAVNGWNVAELRGGVMLSAGAGWKINTPGNAEWMITLGYKMQPTYQERFIWGWWGDPGQPLIIGTRQYRKVVIGCALGF